jgi:hypothetical protein
MPARLTEYWSMDFLGARHCFALARAARQPARDAGGHEG